MTSTNGKDWIYVVNSPTRALNDIVWSPELLRFVAVFSNTDGTNAIYTSDDAIASPFIENFTTITLADGTTRTFLESLTYINELNCVAWSPELNIFVSINERGYIITSSNGSLGLIEQDQTKMLLEHLCVGQVICCGL